MNEHLQNIRPYMDVRVGLGSSRSLRVIPNATHTHSTVDTNSTVQTLK